LPSVNILFNPGSHNFPGGGVKKSLYGEERFGRPALIAATICHFRIVYPNSGHDLLPIANFAPPHQCASDCPHLVSLYRTDPHKSDIAFQVSLCRFDNRRNRCHHKLPRHSQETKRQASVSS
jgi:hypothetical protein